MPSTLDVSERHTTQLLPTFHENIASPSLTTAQATRNPMSPIDPIPAQPTIPEGYTLTSTDVAIILAMCSVVAIIMVIWIICQLSQRVDTRKEAEERMLRINLIAKPQTLEEWETKNLEEQSLSRTISNHHLFCAICLEVIQPNDEIRQLTCRHVFHDKCVVSWFKCMHDSCPVCRAFIWGRFSCYGGTDEDARGMTHVLTR